RTKSAAAIRGLTRELCRQLNTGGTVRHRGLTAQAQRLPAQAAGTGQLRKALSQQDAIMRKLERTGVILLVFIAACLAASWAYGPRSPSAPWPFRTAQAQTLRITFDGGGRISDYIERYSALRLSGGRVVVDGLCISACTIVTALMPAERVCVTPYAQLAFHSAARVNPLTGEQAHRSEGTPVVWEP